MESFGSGSGLLDLSLQADDTSLGAVLDDILPAGAEEGGEIPMAGGLMDEEDLMAEPTIPAGHPEAFHDAFARLHRCFEADVRKYLAGESFEDIAMIGVAKGVDRDHGKEEFHRMGQMPFALRRGDPVQYDPPAYTNRIHRDDCAAVLSHLASAVLDGANLPDVLRHVGFGEGGNVRHHVQRGDLATRAQQAAGKRQDPLRDRLVRQVHRHQDMVVHGVPSAICFLVSI